MFGYHGVHRVTACCFDATDSDVLSNHENDSSILDLTVANETTNPIMYKGGMGLGMHFPGFPEEGDWTKALGVFASEQPALFGTILFLIAVAEGESVGHAGDNFRGKSTKTPGDSGFDVLGLSKKLSPEQAERYKIVELKNGRAAMIAMASLFAFESIPGSVPLMDIFT